jgi:two-component system cell cycle sensor histidine kinase/response regulator CckA
MIDCVPDVGDPQRDASARSVARQELLTEVTGSVLYEHALDGPGASVSGNVRDVFGYDPAEFEARGFAWWRERVHPDDRAALDARFALATDGGGTSWSVEYRVQRRDDSWAIVQDRGRTVAAGDRAPEVAIGVLQDARNVQRFQTHLLHSQRLEMVGQLAAGVAHDFNNVLSAIGGFTSILLDECPTTHPHHEDLAQIAGLVDRAATLTQNLLGFTRRRDQPKPRYIRVSDELARLVPTLKILVGSRVNVELSAAPLEVTTAMDPSLLDQVVLNLAANARDAMPQGGSLRVDVAQGGSDDRPRVILTVRDTGSGIPPEVLRNLFQPFFTTKGERRGTGLGLWLVREIVQGVGGSIHVDSAPGAGTSVSVELPAMDEPPSGDPDLRPRRVDQQAAAPRTCLLIEDERAVRHVTRRILEHHGFRVFEAEAGREGLRLLASHRGEIDVIVTDLHMPGLAGLPLLERLRSEAPEIGCLVMTGLSEGLGEVTTEPDRFDVLPKPCETPALIARAAQLALATQRRRMAA